YCLSSIPERRPAHQQHGDAIGDLLVLDDQDLAALALPPAAGVVVAAAGHRAGRMQRELAALLHGGAIADALDRGREVRDDLIEAGNEYHLACAESIAGNSVAAAVDVDDFAAQRDGVDAADQPVGRRRLAAHANAFAALFNCGDRRAQPVVAAVTQHPEEANLLQRSRAPVHP